MPKFINSDTLFTISKFHIRISSNALLESFSSLQYFHINNYIYKELCYKKLLKTIIIAKIFQWNTLFSWIFELFKHKLWIEWPDKWLQISYISLKSRTQIRRSWFFTTISKWNSPLWFTVFRLQRSSNLGASFAVPKKPFSRHLLDIYCLRHHLPSSLPTKWQIHATLWANYDLVNLAAT